mmetsp:Transcript_45368/g.117439  ORF Transcript_45368/g.117439 Transcript_45368/m.117439 type:complete len:207 (+) Transcript_45368:1132-1752(+)
MANNEVEMGGVKCKHARRIYPSALPLSCSAVVCTSSSPPSTTSTSSSAPSSSSPTSPPASGCTITIGAVPVVVFPISLRVMMGRVTVPLLPLRHIGSSRRGHLAVARCDADKRIIQRGELGSGIHVGQGGTEVLRHHSLDGRNLHSIHILLQNQLEAEYSCDTHITANGSSYIFALVVHHFEVFSHHVATKKKGRQKVEHERLKLG